MGGASCWFLVMSAILLVIMGCDRPEENNGPQYEKIAAGPQEERECCRVAVHPLHNPTQLSVAYGSLIDYLNERIDGTFFRLEASTNYASYEQKIRQGTLEFLLPNPLQTLWAIEGGYEVLAMAGDAGDFRGIILTRKDSAIKEVTDLRGAVISYPAPTALAACIMPQYFLSRHGLDIMHDTRSRYVGSQESSIMNVYLGEAAAGATWPPPWRMFLAQYPERAKEIEVKWQTEPLVNNSFMARKDLPDVLKEQVKTKLLHLHESAEGEKILKSMETARFFAADDSTYEVVKEFMARFEREIRPVSVK